MDSTKMPIYYPGLKKDQQEELEIRLQEFEMKHEANVVNGGSGYVKRIRKKDFIIAWTINIVILIWYVASVLNYWNN